VKIYKDVLIQDASNIEAIACVGMHHFYTDQPEVALRFYRYELQLMNEILKFRTQKTDTIYNFRRLLQMGVYTPELFINLGLCCFYSQQYDMTLNCFQRGLSMAGSQVIADVWYNLGQISMVRI
jgi:tetratricopeptide repeat protein 8